MVKIFQSIMSLVGILGSFPTSLPSDHPASIEFSAWLAAFNTADEVTLTAYHTGPIFPYSVASRDVGSSKNELGLARASGGFDVVEVESMSSPFSVVVVLKEKKRPQYARVSVVVDVSQLEYPVTSFEIHPIPTPFKYISKDDPRWPEFEKAYAPLTAQLRRRIVHGLSDVIRDQYVHPDLGEKIVAALSVHLEGGEYESIEDSQEFADRLTLDMHNVGHDSHMFIIFHEPPPNMPEGKYEPRKHLEPLKEMNFAFGEVSFDTESARGKVIARLPINGFVPSTEDFAADWKDIRNAIGSILSSIADADALIVDLRSNHGGQPNTVAFIESFILDDAPLHLLDFVDRSGKVEDSFSTLPENELPTGTRRFGGKKPLYVLTSKNTISVGEDMAYNLKEFKRATAIIGEGNEATAGAANPITTPRFICEDEFGKGWWHVGVPNLKAVHEITGTNWEGVGVKSDIIAGQGDWLDVADAQEIARRLATKFLQPEQEL